MAGLIYKNEVYNIIGAAMAVHSELGCGFAEAVYQDALKIEFDLRHIPYEKEKKLVIFYKGIKIDKDYYADFVCYNEIIVELKAVKTLLPEHQSQLLNYMKSAKSRVGLLINFGEASLKYKRMVW